MSSESEELNSDEESEFDELEALRDNFSPDFKIRLLQYIGQTNIGSCNMEIYNKIKPLFESEFKSVRGEAFRAAGLIFSKSANKEILEEFKKYIKKEKQDLAIIGIIDGISKILEDTHNEEYYSILKDFLFHKNKLIRKVAIKAIEAIFNDSGNMNVVQDILKSLSLSESDVNEYIGIIENIIGRPITDKNFIDFLSDSLNKEDYQTAIGATRILAVVFKSKTFIDDNIVTKLIDLAKKEPKTRFAVANAFREIYAQSKNKKITEFLEELLKNEKNRDTRKAIIEAIKEITREIS